MTSNNLPFEVTDVFWMIAAVWDKYDIVGLQGGTSSSKTYSVLQWLTIKAAEKRRVITVAGQDLPNLKAGPIRDLEHIVSNNPTLLRWVKGGKWSEAFNKSESKLEFISGSVIEFKSYENSQDAQSGKRDILFANEVKGIPKAIFDELHDRSYEKTLLDYNPTSKFWFHEMAKQPEVVRLISNFTHNRFCPPKIVERLKRYKGKNPYRWRVYGLGLTGQVTGVIYPNVEFITADKWPGADNMDKYGYGMDYGYSNDPLALVDAGLYRGDIYARALIYKTGLKLSKIAKLLDMLEVDEWDVIAMDDSQAKEQADLLRDEYGYFVKSANRRAGSILSGIGILQDYFIYIVDTSDGDWEKEQENYKWLERLGETVAKPVDDFNHLWDALRYWALEMLTTVEVEEFEGHSFSV